MAMDEETKKRLDEISRRKRGILLKDLSTTDLMIACDHWEEYGKMPKEWDGSLEAAMTGPDMGKGRFVAGRLPLQECLTPRRLIHES